MPTNKISHFVHVKLFAFTLFFMLSSFRCCYSGVTQTTPNPRYVLARFFRAMPRKFFPVNIVGPQIRKLRYRAGISQEEMAARCQRAGLDISRSTLAQIEIRFRYVSDQELYILARALNISPNDLYPAEMRKPFSKLMKPHPPA